MPKDSYEWESAMWFCTLLNLLTPAVSIVAATEWNWLGAAGGIAWGLLLLWGTVHCGNRALSEAVRGN